MNFEEMNSLLNLRQLPEGAPVLTAYLPMEPGTSLRQGYEARLMDILRETEKTLTGSDRAAYEVEAQGLLATVRDEGFRPRGRTLLLISSSPRALFEAFPLEIELPGLARFARQPYFAPIDFALDEFPRVAVAVIDEREARLFLTFLGDIESEGHFKDPVPGRQRQGAWSAHKYERDRVRHVREHFQHVAEELQGLRDRFPFKRLVIGATAETTSGFLEVLAPALRQIVAGDFRAELFAEDAKLVEQALPIAAAAERLEEQQLLQAVKERVGAGGNGALGRDETIQCLGEGRVQVLIITAESLGSDAVDAALVQAWETGARVEVVQGEAQTMLRDLGGMGALLRY